MVESSDHIRNRVLGLVDRRMLVEEAVEEFESRK
jgi:type I site-specific restriction endonuclease